MEGTDRKNIRPGLLVDIVLKEDQPTGKLTRGTVAAILTSKGIHPRGIKVRLEDGRVGRVQRIVAMESSPGAETAPPARHPGARAAFGRGPVGGPAGRAGFSRGARSGNAGAGGPRERSGGFAPRPYGERRGAPGDAGSAPSRFSRDGASRPGFRRTPGGSGGHGNFGSSSSGDRRSFGDQRGSPGGQAGRAGFSRGARFRRDDGGEDRQDFRRPEPELPAKFYPCPCCGYLTIDRPTPGSYEVCGVCYWEDNPEQAADPDSTIGGNGVSLNEGRKNFAVLGACEPRYVGAVRKPKASEIPKQK